MPLNDDKLSEESLARKIMLVIRIYHPSIRIRIAHMKKIFARFIHEDGPKQLYWISIYKTFFKLCSNVDQHMFDEEIGLFPRLVLLERNNPDLSKSREALPLKIMENEHRSIFQQWLAVKNDIAGYKPSSEDAEDVINLRREMAEFEKELRHHESFEAREIYGRSLV
jgi:iron-sulfur cluster repair protein YtfE (RIC family)